MKLLFYIFLLSISYSQTTGKISGTVLEKDKSAPLPGANIYLVNTAYGADQMLMVDLLLSIFLLENTL